MPNSWRSVASLEQRVLARVKARYDAHPGEPLVWDVLVISGGGDKGAFGAGFLKGWSRVHGPLAKPEFDVVTGVSTGALIAPFAFLGDDQSIESVRHALSQSRAGLGQNTLALLLSAGQ